MLHTLTHTCAIYIHIWKNKMFCILILLLTDNMCIYRICQHRVVICNMLNKPMWYTYTLETHMRCTHTLRLTYNMYIYHICQHTWGWFTIRYRVSFRGNQNPQDKNTLFLSRTHFAECCIRVLQRTLPSRTCSRGQSTLLNSKLCPDHTSHISAKCGLDTVCLWNALAFL